MTVQKLPATVEELFGTTTPPPPPPTPSTVSKRRFDNDGMAGHAGPSKRPRLDAGNGKSGTGIDLNAPPTVKSSDAMSTEAAVASGVHDDKASNITSPARMGPEKNASGSKTRVKKNGVEKAGKKKHQHKKPDKSPSKMRPDTNPSGSKRPVNEGEDDKAGSDETLSQKVEGGAFRISYK